MSSTKVQRLDILLSPFDEDSCGEDPSYHPLFESIKIELTKLTGTDFSLIKHHCETLLSNTAKDLRLACYWLYASTYIQGLDGLYNGLSLLTQFISTYGDKLYPSKPKAKLAALGWLNNPKLLAFIKQEQGRLDHEKKQEIVSEISALNQAIHNYLGEQYPPFNLLNSWLKSINLNEPKKTFTEKIGLKRKQPPAGVEMLIENEKQFQQMGYQLWQFAHKEKHILRTLMLSRSLKWSGLTLPQHQNNKTYIEPPRKEAGNQLQALIAKDEASALLSFCEATFMESSGHFWLDLQYYSYQCLQTLNLEQEACYLKETLVLLLKQNQGLAYLSFKNDLPFANEDTLNWLQSITVTAQPKIGSSVNIQEITAQSLIKEAKKSAGSKGISAQISVIQKMHFLSPKEELEKAYAIALLTLKERQFELAQLLFSQLDKRIDEIKANLWAPNLAIKIWFDYYQLLQAQKSRNEPLAAILKEKICKADLVKALALFNP